jgi:hypothetical protein
MQIRRGGIETGLDAQWTAERETRFELVVFQDIDRAAMDQREGLLVRRHGFSDRRRRQAPQKAGCVNA